MTDLPLLISTLEEDDHMLVGSSPEGETAFPVDSPTNCVTSSRSGSQGGPTTERDFVCAICRREVYMRWNARQGPQRTLPPLCNYCEGEYSRGVGRPIGGTYRDRREVMRGFALVEALRSEAAISEWGSRHAS